MCHLKMKLAALFLMFTVIFLAEPVNTVTIPDEAFLDFPQLVARESSDYTAQTFTARTSDGYLLAVHRIQLANRGQGHAVPVLLMHGMAHRSEDFVRMGRTRSLAYLLADEGFDVWVGNMRTTEYTSHVSLLKSDPAYWNYSLDDLGSLDLPAILETMRTTTGTGRLHYVGYSMGTTAYYIMCAARPDLAARVASYTALASVATINPQLRDTAVFLKAGLEALQIGASIMGPDTKVIKDLLTTVCMADTQETEICTRAVVGIIGEDYDQFDWTKYPTIVAKFQVPALRIMDHYLQLAISGSLAKFDYGKWENIKRYRQFSPPKYDLTANRAPAALFFGKNDLLSTPQVSLNMSQKLKMTSPAVYERPIAYEKFNHVDFVWAKDLDTLLNHDVVNMIKSFSQTYDSIRR